MTSLNYILSLGNIELIKISWKDVNKDGNFVSRLTKNLCELMPKYGYIFLDGELIDDLIDTINNLVGVLHEMDKLIPILVNMKLKWNLNNLNEGIYKFGLTAFIKTLSDVLKEKCTTDIMQSWIVFSSVIQNIVVSS